MTYETHTWSEIQSQPAVWPSALEVVQQHAEGLRALLAEGACDHVVVTGCGSTYYLALAAAALVQSLTGRPARGVPASEIWLSGEGVFPSGQRALLVAVSRSGETTETLRAVESFRAHQRGAVLTLSCYPGRALATMGDMNLLFPEAQEESVAQTRAFSTLYLASAAVAATWAGRADVLAQLAALPQAAQAILDSSLGLAGQLARDPGLKRVFFLGSAGRYGLACELSLKMKEMSLSDSEPFHFMEYRHGPQSMASPESLIVGLLSQRNHQHERAVLDEMRAHGATVVAIGPGGDVPFPDALDDAASGALYLPFGQMLAYERATSRGLNPDRPHNLDAVVRLEALPTSG
ncbi:SIS domain-containing protein [Chloroflexia bacterium SDU3-3]|nr:SIS domain-containing protein [Chloroflexia bacterium SDU3-3]